MKTVLSEQHRDNLENYIVTDGLNHQMIDTMLEYLLTLRASESTKELYLQRLRIFGLWLVKNNIRRFTDVKRFQFNLFLSGYQKNNTKNSYITALRPFLRFLGKDVHLDYYAEEMEPITPSDVLTPDEVILRKETLV